LPSREIPRKNPREFFAKRLQDAKLVQGETLAVPAQAGATGAAIDTLVYELCGLIEEEIKIRERAGKK
jgi:hypothetical protein